MIFSWNIHKQNSNAEDASFCLHLHFIYFLNHVYAGEYTKIFDFDWIHSLFAICFRIFSSMHDFDLSQIFIHKYAITAFLFIIGRVPNVVQKLRSSKIE